MAAHRRGARQPAHIAARMDVGQPRRAPAARRRLLRPAGRGGPVAERRRPPVLHGLAGRSRRAAARRGADGGRAVHRRGQARGVRPRPGLAVAHGPAVAQQGGQSGPRRGDRTRRWRGHPRSAGPPDGQPPPEDGGAPARRGAGEGRRVRRRDRPLLRTPRRRRAPGRSAAAADGDGLRSQSPLARRPAADPRARPSTRSTSPSGSAGRTPTARTRTTRSPGSTTSCTTRGCMPTHCRRRCHRRRSAGRTTSRPSGPTPPSGRPTPSHLTGSGPSPAVTPRRSSGGVG